LFGTKAGDANPFGKMAALLSWLQLFRQFVLVSQIEVTNVYILAPFIDFYMFDTISSQLSVRAL